MRLFDIRKLIVNVICFIIIIIGIITCSCVLSYDLSESFISNDLIDNYNNSNVTFAIYVENDDGEYEEYSSSSFPTNMVYNEDYSGCTDYDGNVLSGILSYEDGVASVNTEVTTYCTLYFDKLLLFYEYLTATSADAGGTDETLIEHAEGCDNGCAEDGKYRYSGASDDVNNYVCFGTNDLNACLANTDTYLFRIIEVDPDTGNVKLIKSSELLGSDVYKSYSGTDDIYHWNVIDGTGTSVYQYNNTSYYNYWAVDDTLYATLATDLNTTYLNTFDSEWQSIIDTYNWGTELNPEGLSTYSIKEFYDLETSTKASFKIGLMNVYDYGYATESTYWLGTTNGVFGYNSESYLYDWLYSGVSEWTITRYYDLVAYVFIVNSYGNIIGTGAWSNYDYVVRPSFYLTSNVIYVSGSGTESSPYLLSWI